MMQQRREAFKRRKERFDRIQREWKGFQGVGTSHWHRAELASRWQQWAAKAVEAGDLTAELASRWQQWAAKAVEAGDLTRLAAMTHANHPNRTCKGHWWWCSGHPPVQADLSLEKGDTNMTEMLEVAQSHPLTALDGPGKPLSNWLMVDTKVNSLATLSVKRPHAWAHPVRQMAAIEKWKSNMGRGGRGFARELALQGLASRWRRSPGSNKGRGGRGFAR